MYMNEKKLMQVYSFFFLCIKYLFDNADDFIPTCFSPPLDLSSLHIKPTRAEARLRTFPVARHFLNPVDEVLLSCLKAIRTVV